MSFSRVIHQKNFFKFSIYFVNVGVTNIWNSFVKQQNKQDAFNSLYIGGEQTRTVHCKVTLTKESFFDALFASSAHFCIVPCCFRMYISSCISTKSNWRASNNLHNIWSIRTTRMMGPNWNVCWTSPYKDTHSSTICKFLESNNFSWFIEKKFVPKKFFVKFCVIYAMLSIKVLQKVKKLTETYFFTFIVAYLI